MTIHHIVMASFTVTFLSKAKANIYLADMQEIEYIYCESEITDTQFELLEEAIRLSKETP